MHTVYMCMLPDYCEWYELESYIVVNVLIIIIVVACDLITLTYSELWPCMRTVLRMWLEGQVNCLQLIVT